MPSAPTHRKRSLDELACVHPNAAGLIIGSEEIVVRWAGRGSLSGGFGIPHDLIARLKAN